MARVDVLGGSIFDGNPLTIANFTLSGTGRSVYICLVHNAASGGALDTVDIGSTTIFEAGVDETRQIANFTAVSETNHRMRVFRVFDTDLPANADYTVTVTFASSARCVCVAVSYDGADQSTGHRGTPVTYNTEDANLSLAPTVDSGDIETLGFFSWSGSITHAPTSPTVELLADINAATAIRMVPVQRPAGGQPLEGTLSGDSSRDAGWAASILTVAGESLVKVIDEGMNIAGATSRQSIAIIGS